MERLWVMEITDKNLPINESYWKSMDEKQLNIFKEEIFQYYRNKGFPYYNLTVEQQKESIGKMDIYMNSNKNIIEGNIVRQTMHCLSTAWSYFPKSWEVITNNKYSPIQLFNDDELFRKIISKRLKRGTYISDSGLRKELKTNSLAQGVSNFRPTASRAIYDKYSGNGYVFDPCMGYGGRLLGAISSPRVKYYEGCDPNTETFDGLSKMAKNLQDTTKVVLNNIGVEEYEPKDKFDLVFTSPPYFDTEKYSEEETQSYLKFPTYEKWLNGFLRKLVENSIDLLNNGGYFIINIANVKNAKNLESDFNEICKGFLDLKYVKMYKMQLSSINKLGHKYEPIFVYNKT